MNFFSWIRKIRESRKWKKSDWLILILAGALLLIVAMPTSKGGTESAAKEEDEERPAGSEETGLSNEEYAAKLTAELEEVLASMSGVGKVKVMITLEDDGETVVDKNISSNENAYSQETVLLDQDDNTVPYVTNRKYPKVAGVVVVAQGAGNGGVSTDITEMVMALFSIDAHKVKVVKMG